MYRVNIVGMWNTENKKKRLHVISIPLAVETVPKKVAWKLLCFYCVTWHFHRQLLICKKKKYTTTQLKAKQFHRKYFITTALWITPHRSAQEMNGQAVYSKAEAESNHVGVNPEEVEVLLSKKKESQQPSFLHALIRAFGPYFLIGSAFKLLQDVVVFINPQLLRWRARMA